jgi:membrane-bound metal-dependent hydrolase YbcI (DUF457 family)
MPSPIAHSLIGICLGASSNEGIINIFQKKYLNYLLIIFISVTPDLDVIPGFFVGLPTKYHHGITHSFFSAIIFGLLFSYLIYIFKKKYFFARFLLFAIICSFHIIFDLFSIDTGEVNGFGMPIFFPFSSFLYRSSVSLFSSSLTKDGYLTINSIIRYSNLFPIIIEIFLSLLVGILIVVIVKFLNYKRTYSLKKE